MLIHASSYKTTNIFIPYSIKCESNILFLDDICIYRVLLKAFL